ncbi:MULTISPECIES: RidA family protein [unclassified Pseudomonas]|uniref:RidA family protein n=1 Tax=unclassified Pseudomonas TaxID=196821 RepID=UPI000CD20B99|nr:MULTISPECIES: RidA family protein [unclassified Pseudomonas]POA14669.1 RidA family protein [Pseudomonas sp. MPBD7-1]
MTINRLNSGPRLSAAATYGNLVFLSGQVPGDGVTASSQTLQVLDKIDALLAEVGSHKDLILSATIYLKDIGRDFAAMNDVWETWLTSGKAPTRTTMQAELARPEVLVEITVVAAVQ